MTAPRTYAPSLLPPPDTALSPFTGYTRSHWEAHADRLLAGLTPYATPHLAQYRLPGRAGHAGAWSDGLEGYARSFMLAAFRIAGAGGRDAPGSTVISELISRYSAGLAAGTDPDDPEHWPPITDRSQSMVEAASVVVALHETRPWLWERLPDAVRQRVASWLEGFVGARPNDSNWRLFQVVTEEFLASVGARHRRSEIESGLDRLEDWYRGDGWYTDGDGRKFDYYNAMALHLYPVLWQRIAGDRADAARVAEHRTRLRSFIEDHQHFFGADGAPVHQGRSLTYRFATSAPLWAGALAGVSPLPPGRTRRIASGALKHFADRGAVPGRDGLLSLGWYRPFLPATQPYSGPASPYWAAKAFLGLLLPAGHPVWTAPEEPSPVDTADRYLALPAPGWLLHSTAADGIVRLVNHGSDRLPPPPAPSRPSPHYSRFAYSSATAPETPPEGPDGPDNHIALLGPAGVPTFRGRIHPLYVHDRQAASWHAPSGDEAGSPGIVSACVVHGPWEMRLHLVRAPAGSSVREGGWAVARDDAPPVGTSGPGWAVARRRDGLTSALFGVLGWDEDGRLPDGEVEQALDRNAVGRHSATPLLRLPHHPGGTRLLATLVVLTSDPRIRDDLPRPGRLAHASPAPDGTIGIVFPDGWSTRVGLLSPVPPAPGPSAV
ncbi:MULTISPECIES: DUF2264 domain-containing protein [unclassified Streptomyces]|uniref:DUF2264 domain-containing protein n=1 Tax=unclassified Streptomyces TaxID=2593676 RepID=UPI00093DCEDF|nr:DUF2264 domain-containing protein [Streptomyces sp. CB02058]OKI92686.1 hypothetical protein AMK10_23490 [Streptomyces sp. CB02058]